MKRRLKQLPRLLVLPHLLAHLLALRQRPPLLAALQLLLACHRTP